MILCIPPSWIIYPSSDMRDAIIISYQNVFGHFNNRSDTSMTVLKTKTSQSANFEARIFMRWDLK